MRNNERDTAPDSYRCHSEERISFATWESHKQGLHLSVTAADINIKGIATALLGLRNDMIFVAHHSTQG